MQKLVSNLSYILVGVKFYNYLLCKSESILASLNTCGIYYTKDKDEEY